MLLSPPGGVVGLRRSLAPYLCCSFGISIKNLVSCFSWGFPGFSGRFSKEEEVGRGRNTQISHLYSSVVSSFASNLLETPVISGIVNPSCLGTGNLHSCLAALEQNSERHHHVSGMLLGCWWLQVWFFYSLGIFLWIKGFPHLEFSCFRWM